MTMNDMSRAVTETGRNSTSPNLSLLVGGFGPLGEGTSAGIDWMTFVDGDRGDVLTHRGLLAELPSPSWLAYERLDGHEVIYTVLEHTAEVVSLRLFWLGGRPHLVLLSRVRVPGRNPTHVARVDDPAGFKHLIVACYGDGAVCVLPVDHEGRLGEVEQTLPGEGNGPLPAQRGSHAHWIQPLPDGRVLTSDLGADRVRIHRWEHHMLRRVGAVVCAPGTGPRDIHMLPMPAGFGMWTAAVVGEWGCTVITLTPRRPGSDDIAINDVVDLGYRGHDQAASLAFVPDDSRDPGTGFAYVGLRGSNRIVPLRWENARLFRLADSGTDDWHAGVPSGGDSPRHILAAGRRLLVANQFSGTVDSFSVAENGDPVHTGQLSLGSPTTLLPLR